MINVRKAYSVCAASVLLLFVFTSAGAKNWITHKDCTLEPNPSNDGDSFHVRCKNRPYLFRLYFVDTPETDDTFPDRVKEQADYWAISTSDAIRLGEKAKKFTETYLKNGFTVYTRRHDARGRSHMTRYYAMVETDEGYLSHALVENGLARIHGEGVKLPNGISEKTYWWRLKSAKRRAKSHQLGGWALSRSPSNTIATVLQPKSLKTSSIETPSVSLDKDVVLDKTIAVYSLKSKDTIVGYLHKGSEVHLLKMESAGMVRVRFKTSEGNVFEAQCRKLDVIKN